MKIIIELIVPDDDPWAVNPPESVGISSNRLAGHAERKGAHLTKKGIIAGSVTSIRYKGETL